MKARRDAQPAASAILRERRCLEGVAPTAAPRPWYTAVLGTGGLELLKPCLVQQAAVAHVLIKFLLGVFVFETEEVAPVQFGGSLSQPVVTVIH